MNNQTRSIAKIINELAASGIVLWVDGDELRFKAPVGQFSPQQRDILKVRKQEFIEHLKAANTIQEDAASRHEPFPLTDLQLAYVVGRRDNYELGGVGCHNYLELDMPPLDLMRLEQAWHALIMRHDMLRAVISSDGQQHVLRMVDLPAVYCDDVRGMNEAEFENAVLKNRKQLAFRRYDPEHWPLYELRLTLYDDRCVLHYSTDLLIADFASIQLLLAELGQLYHHPETPLAPLSLTFRDVVMFQRKQADFPDAKIRLQAHRNYWMQRLPDMPGAPELPLLPYSKHRTENEVSFQRYSFDLPEQDWRKLSKFAAQWQLTPTSTIMAAFVEVLRLWSRQSDFCITLTLFNRPAIHTQIEKIVGDFIALNILQARADDGENFLERAKTLQSRLWQDMEHSDFSGIEVLRQWSRLQGSNQMIPVVFTSTLGILGHALPKNDFMHDARPRYAI